MQLRGRALAKYLMRPYSTTKRMVTTVSLCRTVFRIKRHSIHRKSKIIITMGKYSHLIPWVLHEASSYHPG